MLLYFATEGVRISLTVFGVVTQPRGNRTVTVRYTVVSKTEKFTVHGTSDNRAVS